MLIAIAISLVMLTSILHLIVLQWLSGSMSRIEMSPGFRVLVIVLAVLLAHLVEVALYGGAYATGDRVLGIGDLEGAPVSTALDYFYFSIVSYTSLGIGDIFPSAHLRFIAGVEALNGLLLIAWSGSFIYIAMRIFGLGRLVLNLLGRLNEIGTTTEWDRSPS
jgi:hypothetical protein